jgi:hypothetical protein
MQCPQINTLYIILSQVEIIVVMLPFNNKGGNLMEK